MFTSINGHGLCSTANFAKISDTHLATCSYRSSIEAPTSKSSACGSSFSLSSQRILNIHHQRCSQRLVARRGIKWIENFETQLDIPEDRRKALEEFLQNETFCSQVAKETKNEGPEGLEFSGILFQPVPWSPATTKGMPAEYEKYHADPDYSTINVPPNFLFKAQIFKPSRLCAIYRKKGARG